MAKTPLVYLALSESVAQKVKEILKGFNCRVESVPDGEALINLSRETLPDLIIIEKEIPKLDGYAAVLLLKNDEKTAEIPVVGICKCLSDIEAEKARDAGCDDYVCYPFEKEELEKILEKFLVR
ncbi:response regulator [Thermosulfurimonas dismutans]|uniref:Two-component response regulator n=1 Tax=Thermosulfurimonas dismutans TaxID=999894 RepID=A0A179D545_9BACT|nr:response regulator [Thermosulfurimonas dismutans]OAQ21166.1 Two-component response regulator [Thermosulfurimonas dismutans]